MEQPTDETPQRGRLTRWLFGEEGQQPSPDHRELLTAPSDVIDIRTHTPPDVQTRMMRMDRLEMGMRLMADAMKRAYGNIATSVATLTYELRNDHGRSNGDPKLQQSVASLNLTIDELLHSMRAFPHVLAAATDELSERIEAVEERTTGTLGELLRQRNGDTAEPADAPSNGG